MRLSISDIKLHTLCPMKFHYATRLKRGVDFSEPAQDIGTLAHKILEIKLLGGEWREALDKIECEHKDWPSVALVLTRWNPDPGWKIHAVEEEMSLPIDFLGYEIVGRPDAVVEWQDGFWHLQHKTMASSKPTAVFAETQRTDWHECIYQLMLENKGYRPFRGTILNCIRKLSLKTLENTKGYETFYLPREEKIVSKAFADIRARLVRINGENIGANIEMTRGSCGGIFGNRLCQYKGVCDGWQSIDDKHFTDLKDRYEETMEPAAAA